MADDDDKDIDLLAASLRADSDDIEVFLKAIAAKLQEALPQRTKVLRRRIHMLSTQKRIERIVVDLGDAHYSLLYDGKEVEARVSKVTRGIALKSENLSLDAWIDSLAHALDAEARDSERGRLAMQRLLGVGP